MFEFNSFTAAHMYMCMFWHYRYSHVGQSSLDHKELNKAKQLTTPGMCACTHKLLCSLMNLNFELKINITIIIYVCQCFLTLTCFSNLV